MGNSFGTMVRNSTSKGSYVKRGFSLDCALLLLMFQERWLLISNTVTSSRFNTSSIQHDSYPNTSNYPSVLLVFSALCLLTNCPFVAILPTHILSNSQVLSCKVVGFELLSCIQVYCWGWQCSEAQEIAFVQMLSNLFNRDWKPYSRVVKKRPTKEWLFAINVSSVEVERGSESWA